jgi:hypothetical protein
VLVFRIIYYILCPSNHASWSVINNLIMGCKQSRSIPYGGDLQVMWTQNPEIPGIVVLCGDFLKTIPSCIEKGLFRTPASRYVDTRPSDKGELEALRQNPSYNPRVLNIKRFRALANIHSEQDIPWNSIRDPHVVAGMYKLFFRQLNPPLLTFMLYDKWVSAQKQDNELAYVVSMRSLFGALPTAHQRVLLHALDLFDVLLQPNNRKKNGLTIERIAHEFGPLFLRPQRSGEGASGKLSDMTSSAVKCLHSMLTMKHHIFQRTNEEEFVRLSREMEK